MCGMLDIKTKIVLMKLKLKFWLETYEGSLPFNMLLLTSVKVVVKVFGELSTGITDFRLKSKNACAIVV